MVWNSVGPEPWLLRSQLPTRAVRRPSAQHRGSDNNTPLQPSGPGPLLTQLSVAASQSTSEVCNLPSLAPTPRAPFPTHSLSSQWALLCSAPEPKGLTVYQHHHHHQEGWGWEWGMGAQPPSGRLHLPQGWPGDRGDTWPRAVIPGVGDQMQNWLMRKAALIPSQNSSLKPALTKLSH